MSQFVALRSKMRNKEILLAALAKLGLDVHSADVSDKLIEVRDMYGKPQMVAVAVRKAALVNAKCRGVYSDIGFVKDADGTYTAWVDHLTAIPVTRDGQTTMTPIGQAVEAAYKSVTGDAAMSKILTKTIPDWKAKGKIPANATVRKVKQGSTTQLVLSYTA